MKKSVMVLLATAVALTACGRPTDATNVADASNNAGMALENSAQELEGTTDTLVEHEIANINAEANAAASEAATDNTAN